MRAQVTSVSLVLLCLLAQSALAQDKAAAKRDDLDVTMQIITDPDARVPDEVVRQIPLPTRKSPASSAPNAKDSSKTDTDATGKEQAQEAKALGRDAAKEAKDTAREATEQREQARRSRADERRRNRNPPDPPRGPPPR